MSRMCTVVRGDSDVCPDLEEDTSEGNKKRVLRNLLGIFIFPEEFVPS